MEQLLAKERELAAKTAELAKRDREVRLALQKMQPNWPRKCCCISPIVYHSIASEVPTDRVTFVTTCYYCYYFTIVMLIYNVVCGLVAMVSEEKQEISNDDKANWLSHFIVTFVHCLGIGFAFFVWYFPIYQATSTFEAGKYKTAYLGLAVALIYDIFMTVGLVGYGGCGWLFALKTRDKKSETPFWMSLVMAILWTGQSLFFIWIIYRVRKYARVDRNRSLGDRAKRAISQAVGIPIPGSG